MTIEKGSAWGEAAPKPLDTRWAAGDAELARLAAAAVEQGVHLVAEVGPGDVMRTLGLEGARLGGDQLCFPFDLGFAALDGEAPVPFAAHLCAHRPRWAGPFVVVMNCAWMGEWYLGPQAHPNDGLLDITHGALPLGQRFQARRRARNGTHLPHPALRALRRTHWEHCFERPVEVFADGSSVGRYQRIEVWVQPDCFSLFG